MPLEKVTTAEIREFTLFHQQPGLPGYSLHPSFKSLKAFFSETNREELVDHDPLERVKAPKLPQLLPKVLAPEQAEAFLKHLKGTNLLGRRDNLNVIPLLDTGL